MVHSSCLLAQLALTLLVHALASKVQSQAPCLLQTRQSKSRAHNLGFERGPQNDRQKKIVKMMKHAWTKGYKRHCWGKDELSPVDGSCKNGWHLGLTLVDSLDTLYLMGLDTEFKGARDWVADPHALNFNHVGQVSLFETTIRVLGGLLGAYSLSGDHVFLERAQELGDRLLPAFKGRAGSGSHGSHGAAPPAVEVDVGRKKGMFLRDPNIAESGTLALEFKKLTELTGTAKYAKAVDKVGKAIHKEPKRHGLAPIFVDAGDGHLFGSFKLGAAGDSYYEYLLKQWLLTGRHENVYLRDYNAAINGIRRELVNRTRGPLALTYVAEMDNYGGKSRRMDHLACFLPGTLALGAHYGADKSHMDLAKQLMRTCYEMYNASGHMLGPETVTFDEDGEELVIERQDSHDLLRPETIESLFYLYRLTGDKKYQDWGWKMAKAIEKHAKVKRGGYTSLEDVLERKPPKRDHMDSYFLAETLKYLFLLFDDAGTQVPLDNFVFNTEAHPLRIMSHPLKKH